ncbi:penicillin-binding Tp47 domain C-containing protein [Blautia obeum]|uniref:47 kDa membrane antigen n=1 Tax=Blautia obeum TaxID=40520 RepID=A0A174L7G9_9FIRM|nr:penicillin-binding Tp47 domain C-containing protein [Blautia obeum]CUP20083.1 47 kDa membrane antigen precursor [Blautia obeum]
MANQRLMKKVAPVVLSAAVVMTSMPATAFAADFSDTEVTVAEESADIEEASAEAADTDVVEDTEDTDVDVEEAAEDVTEDEETSDEELFSAEVSEDEFADEVGDGQTEGEAYVLMNIPYDDFYKAELKNNDVKVDTFTSATKQKTRSSLAKGSYHVNSDGSDITGVTFPVKVSDISVLKDKKQIKDNASVSITTAIKGKETTTEYKGKDALFESDSYSYYVLSEEPSYYKELTVGEDGSFTFSAIEGESAVPETKQVQAEFKTKSNYGDYQLKFDKTEFNSIINTDTDTVYGAVINTTDETTYGLCHLENIWKGYELAWSTGYTTESNGCHLNSEHFESMIGKTIDSVTYYASNGIYTLDIADVKVLDKNSYVYAGLTWGEYWSQESVTAAGNVSGSDEKDSHNESDTGAFDAVTRATTNHGLHRGSYQCMATIYTTEGNAYQLSYWKSSTEPVLTDGTVAIWTPADRKTGTPASIQVNGGAKESLDHYAVTGIKYVPVQVKAEDYADFAAKYPVVKNGETLVGGFSENNLKAYRETANVTVNTNGLKTVTKNEDGSFSFSARKTGTESGIQGTDLKVATGIKPEVKTASGSYGEFLRVDLNGNYGGLGAAMQAVKWDYYGNGNTVLATYGTKFAADNWMHKMMGIQLGLTHSVRCQLPAGTDGTGHWKLTVYALGYQDYTFEFDATATNIVTPTDPSTIDTTALKAALEKVKALNKDDYTEESWKKVEDEATETQEMLEEIEAAIKDKTTVAFSQAAVDEQVNEHLTAAINGLVKKEKPVEPVVTPDVKPTVTPSKNETKPTATPTPVVKPGITAKVSQVYVGKKATIKVTKTKVTGKVTFKSSNKKVATVNSKGVITGKKAGKAVITVKVGKYTKKLTVKVKKPSFKLVKSSVKLKKGNKTTIRVKAAPVSKVTYKTSNKKVATVNSKGVVTAKKKGTAKITVKCNGITRTFKVTVK